MNKEYATCKDGSEKIKRLIMTKKRFPNSSETVNPKIYETIELTSLKLAYNNIKSPAVLSMFEFALSRHSKLSHVDISNNPLGTPGIKALVNSIKNPNNLKYLNLADCDINKIGAHHIFTTLGGGASNLNTLILDNNNINGFKPNLFRKFLQELEAKPADKFLGCVYPHTNKGLKTLSLHKCGLDDENMKPLFFSVFKGNTLCKLNLSANEITDHGLKQVAKLMGSKECGFGDLHILDLSCNDFTDKSCVPFCKALLNNKEIQKLSLRKAECTEASINIIYKAMVRDDKLGKLKTFDLRDTMVKPDLVANLKALITANTFALNADKTIKIESEYRMLKKFERQQAAEKRREQKINKLKQ